MGEQLGRRAPLVHPADRAERRPYVGPRRRLDRVPLERRDPARHPLDHQRAVLGVRSDQPRHPDRRAMPDKRPVCPYFVPVPLAPFGRVVQ
jgi:hypothetical protein